MGYFSEKSIKEFESSTCEKCKFKHSPEMCEIICSWVDNKLRCKNFEEDDESNE